MKYDMKKLKADLVLTADNCRKAKREFKDVNRQLSQEGFNMELWRKLNSIRGAQWSHMDFMTLLCSLKAHLRGKLHRSKVKELVDGKWVKLELTIDDQERFIANFVSRGDYLMKP